MIDQRTINKRILNCFKKIGLDRNPEHICNSLDNGFKNFGIRFLYQVDSESEQTEINGYFLPDKPKDKILLIIVFGKIIELDEDFQFEISSTIQHELRHLFQNDQRITVIRHPGYNFKSIDDLEVDGLLAYFNIPDEIDAYALNITLELTRNKDFTLGDLKHTDKLVSSNTLDLYETLGIFKDNTKVRQRLLKKVYKLLQQDVRWIR